MIKQITAHEMRSGVDKGGKDPQATEKLHRAENMWKPREGVLMRRPPLKGYRNANDDYVPEEAQGRLFSYGKERITLSQHEYRILHEQRDAPLLLTPDDEEDRKTGLAFTDVRDLFSEAEGYCAFDSIDIGEMSTTGLFDHLMIVSAFKADSATPANQVVHLRVVDKGTGAILETFEASALSPAQFVMLRDYITPYRRQAFAIYVNDASEVVYVKISGEASHFSAATDLGVANAPDVAAYGYPCVAHKAGGTPARMAAVYYNGAGGLSWCAFVRIVTGTLELELYSEFQGVVGRVVGLDYDFVTDGAGQQAAPRYILMVQEAASSEIVWAVANYSGAVCAGSLISGVVSGTEFILNATANGYRSTQGIEVYDIVFTVADREETTIPVVTSPALSFNRAANPFVYPVTTGTPTYHLAVERRTKVICARSIRDIGGAATMVEDDSMRVVIPQVHLCVRAFRQWGSDRQSLFGDTGEGSYTWNNWHFGVYYEGLSADGYGFPGSAGAAPESNSEAFLTSQRQVVLFKVVASEAGIDLVPDAQFDGRASHWTGMHNHSIGARGSSAVSPQPWMPQPTAFNKDGDDGYGQIGIPVETIATPISENHLRCGGALILYDSRENRFEHGRGDDEHLADWGCSWFDDGKNLYVPGSIPKMYDGERFCEAGFLEFPGLSIEVESGTSNQPGLYPVYAATYRSTDATGRIHRSAISALSVTLAADTDKVTISVPHLPVTSRRSVVIELYRSDDAGATFSKIAQAANGATGTAGSQWHSWLYVDTGYATGETTKASALYTNGEVIEAVHPPSSHAMCEHQRRLFWVRSHDPESSIEYSQQMETFEGLRNSDLFTVNVPSQGGRIVAIASLAGRLIVFKESSIYAVSGEGLNSSAQGAGYSDASLVSDGVGCISQSSIARTPTGLYFQSRIGVLHLSTSLALEPVGKDVTLHTEVDQRIVGAVYDEANGVVMFARPYSSSFMLLYHLAEKAWTTWTTTGIGSSEDGGIRALVAGSHFAFLVAYDSGSAYSNNDIAWLYRGLLASDHTTGADAPARTVDHDAFLVDEVGAGTGTDFYGIIESPWINVAGVGQKQILRRILFLGYLLNARVVDAETGEREPLWLTLSYDYEPIGPFLDYLGEGDVFLDDAQQLDVSQQVDAFMWDSYIDLSVDSSALVSDPQMDAMILEGAPHRRGLRCVAFKWRLFDAGGVAWALTAAMYDAEPLGLERNGTRHLTRVARYTAGE